MAKKEPLESKHRKLIFGNQTHTDTSGSSNVRKMTGKEPNVTVNPNEVVALGAAVQDRPFLLLKT